MHLFNSPGIYAKHSPTWLEAISVIVKSKHLLPHGDLYSRDKRQEMSNKYLILCKKEKRALGYLYSKF